MLTFYLAEHDVIGAAVARAADGGLLLTYSSVDGKHFLKSFDHFRTVAESWTAPIDSITANANLLRLKDGRLMTVVRRLSEDPAIAEIKGASYFAYFSDDDGRTFREGARINGREACYYLMNNRLLRTATGRLLLPMCYVPVELADKEHFEKAGLSDEGESWQEGEWLAEASVDQLAEPMVAEGEDGLLHMYMRTGHGYLYHAVSHSGGVSWECAKPSCLRSACAPFCLNRDPYDGTFYAVWDNCFPGPMQNYPRSPICIARSRDCERWETICELDNDPMRSYGYPMLYFTEQELLLAYYEAPGRKFDKENQKLKLRIVSRDEWK